MYTKIHRYKANFILLSYNIYDNIIIYDWIFQSNFHFNNQTILIIVQYVLLYRTEVPNLTPHASHPSNIQINHNKNKKFKLE